MPHGLCNFMGSSSRSAYLEKHDGVQHFLVLISNIPEIMHDLKNNSISHPSCMTKEIKVLASHHG